MPKSEDGEFELILGNRQLLSVFFIVVILLGVFFTMGYIVGRNSGPMGAQEIAPVRRDGKQALSRAIAQSRAAANTATPGDGRASSKVSRLRSKRPAPERSEPESQPAAGQTYLQLAATTQREADILVDVLRRKNFKARAAEVPEKPGMFRVLVGPIADGALNKTRADLQGAGFPGNAAIPRRF